jgi:hypothetical protein
MIVNRESFKKPDPAGVACDNLYRKSSQSRVAKIEASDTGVSLDLIFRGYFAVEGRLEDLAVKKMFQPLKKAGTNP